MIMKTSDHKSSFDDYYKKLLEEEKGLGIEFPLRDIEKFQWKRGEWNDAFFNWSYRRFSVHILHRLNVLAGSKVLAIGCGFGFDEKNIKQLVPGSSIWSVDISEEMVVHARASGCPSELALAVAEKLPFPDACFDRVVSREVIEHVMDTQAMMNEIRRVLKPGGRAVVTTENPLSLSPHNLYHQSISPLIARMAGHVILGRAYKDEAPTARAIRAMAEHAGLRLAEVIWDGAVYKYQPTLAGLYCERMVDAARRFSALENRPLLGRLFCDQVKYVLDRPADSSANSAEVPRFVCPSCRGDLVTSIDALTCVECNIVYPQRCGIPDLIMYGWGPSGKPAAKAVVNETARKRFVRWNARAERLYNWIYHRLANLAVRFAPANTNEQPSGRIPPTEPLSYYLKLDD